MEEQRENERTHVLFFARSGEEGGCFFQRWAKIGTCGIIKGRATTKESPRQHHFAGRARRKT